MSHYDLYESLKLDRNIAASDAALDIDRRLQSGRFDNPGGADELQIARQVLGDPRIKSEYDRRLSNPNAPEMNISALRQLAAGSASHASGPVKQSGPVNQSGSVAPPAGGQGNSAYYGQPQQGYGPQNSGAGAGFTSFKDSVSNGANTVSKDFKRSSLMAIVITAVATALVVSIVWAGAWFFLKGSDGDKGAEKLAQEFVSLQSERETEDWLRQHASRSERDSIETKLGIGTSNFETVDEYLEGRDLTVGAAWNVNQSFGSSLVARNSQPLNEVFDEVNFVWWSVPVFQDERLLGQVSIAELDGDYRLVELSTVQELDVDSGDIDDIDDLGFMSE